MYYGKQNSFNSDYYNAYENSSYRYQDGKSYLTLILKILLILLFLGLLFFGFIFISNKTTFIESILTEKKVETKDDRANEIKKMSSQTLSTTDSSVVSTSQVNLTQDDIANIVAIVLHKLDTDDSQKNGVNNSDDAYTKELLSHDVDRLTGDKPTLVVNDVNMKKVVKDNQESAHTNHYNKVVINRPKEEQYTNDTLYKLSIELSAINEDSNISSSSSYTQEISKEIAVRSNEMRIIVVKEGDTLSKIAKRAYGNYDDYVKIFDANPEIIKNPNEIYVGQKLRIPL